MINLRYHIVSLAAVFLALGAGILMGSTVIDQGIVTQLEGQTKALRANRDALQTRTEDLQRELDLWEGFGETIVPPLTRGRLPGRAVVLLSQQGIPGGVLDRLAESFLLAGARRPARVRLTAKWDLAQPATIEQLALAIGTPPSDRVSVLREAAARFAARLGSSGDPRQGTDLLRALGNAGFLELGDLPDGAFPASNALIVLVPSGARGAQPPEDGFFVPMLRVLASARVVAVAEPLGVAESLAEKVRGDGALARTVSTVDHVDSVAGRLSLIYGLRDLIAGRLAPHYGVRAGAKGVAPDVGAP